MRITLLSLLLVVIFCVGAKAQDDDLDYYITTSGQKIEGVISLNYANDFIYYKPTKETRKDTKVPINDIKMVVVSWHSKKESHVDTLCVVADGTSKDQKKYFGKLALTSPSMHIYYKSKDMPQLPTYTIRYTTAAAMQAQNGVGQWETGQGGEKLTPMYQEHGSDVTYELTSKNFIEILSKAVADYPDLAEQIQSKTYKFKEINKIFQQYADRNN